MIQIKNAVLALSIILVAACQNRNIEGTDKTYKSMVVSAHPQATKIGIQILEKGGNAFDAMVATELALAVCLPRAGNIAGGGFMVARLNDGSSISLDYREKAPLQAHRDMYLDSAGNITKSSTLGGLAVGVPGTIDGIIKVYEKYCSLPFEDLINPAIELAEKGYPLTAQGADNINYHKNKIDSVSSYKTHFGQRELWKAGDTIIHYDLAQTLKRIRDNKRDGFYKGETAAMIIASVAKHGGIISQEDLDMYSAKWRQAHVFEVDGYRYTSMGLPSSGGIILNQTLNMLETSMLGRELMFDENYVQSIVEAERRAFADRANYLGDSDFVDLDLDKLVSKKYAKQQFESYDSTKASSSYDFLLAEFAAKESKETTHYSIVDKFGNAISVTTTLNSSFGSKLMVEGGGFLLNNQMDDFSIKPGFPNDYGLIGNSANSVEPQKRMLSSMSPCIVEKNGKVILVVGSPGGSTIPTTVLQVILNSIYLKMPIQQAVDAARFHHQCLPDIVEFEENAIDSSIIRQLIDENYRFQRVRSLGRVSAIWVDENGNLVGGADKRGDNSAMGI